MSGIATSIWASGWSSGLGIEILLWCITIKTLKILWRKSRKVLFPTMICFVPPVMTFFFFLDTANFVKHISAVVFLCWPMNLKLPVKALLKYFKVVHTLNLTRWLWCRQTMSSDWALCWEMFTVILLSLSLTAWIFPKVLLLLMNTLKWWSISERAVIYYFELTVKQHGISVLLLKAIRFFFNLESVKFKLSLKNACTIESRSNTVSFGCSLLKINFNTTPIGIYCLCFPISYPSM